ncbi:hypothetical protein HN587_00925 [Candidatus Woesearchaeota archaeon]|jgi:hypothetical protein|nr:hypothetical protein [Candidatus Woesearchaeota archaeon]
MSENQDWQSKAYALFSEDTMDLRRLQGVLGAGFKSQSDCCVGNVLDDLIALGVTQNHTIESFGREEKSYLASSSSSVCVGGTQLVTHLNQKMSGDLGLAKNLANYFLLTEVAIYCEKLSMFHKDKKIVVDVSSLNLDRFNYDFYYGLCSYFGSCDYYLTEPID